jgi:phosphoribosylanthranilate isomerase
MIAHWCGIASNRDSRLKQRTFVGLVFNRDSRRNGFQALKTCGWLEIRALLAAVQRGAALGTLTFPIHTRWQRSGTTETAGRHYILQEPW